MLRTDPSTALRRLGLVLVASLPYLDALTNPLHRETNTVTDWAILCFLLLVITIFLVSHVSRPISYTVQSLKAFSPLLPLLLFGGIYWLSYLLNPSDEGFQRCVRFTVLIIPYCFTFLTLIRHPSDVSVLLRVLFWGGVGLSLLCLVFRTYTPFAFLSHGYDLSGMHRGHGRYLAFGTLASCAAVIGLIRFCEAPPGDKRTWPYLLSVPIALAGTIISGERASPILFVVSCIFYFFYLFAIKGEITAQARKLRRLSWVFGLALVCGAGVASLGLAEFSREHWKSGYAIEGRFNYRSGAYAVPFYTNMSKDPIFGVGPANYFKKYGFPYNASNFPHNFFLEIGGEMGVIGLSVYGLLLVGFFRGLWTACKLDIAEQRNGLYICLCAVALMLFIRTFKMGSVPRSIQFWLYWSLVMWVREFVARRSLADARFKAQAPQTPAIMTGKVVVD